MATSRTEDSRKPVTANAGSVTTPIGLSPALVVGIGASAGGLEALERLLGRMPVDSDMAFVVVQHLSPDFKSMMDELLSRWTAMPVHRVEHGMEIQPNRVYLMPPKKEMIISGGRLLLADRRPSDKWSLPIDQFLHSLAADAGGRAVGVILSGSGSDGSRGVQAVHEAGGLVLVQTEESARFTGMPQSALRTGIVDLALAPEEMPRALMRHGARWRLAESEVLGESTSGMASLLAILHNNYGLDFCQYKPATVTRRAERRLRLLQLADLDAYVQRLQYDPSELDALYHDLLIGVTGFFRDEAAFDVLAQDVLPDLLERLGPEDEFRAWVAGCATGEEAYSLAILIHEQMERLGRCPKLKVFATDVHRKSLDVASAGWYPHEALKAVSSERRERYFIRNTNGYQVSPELRQLVAFAPHNVTKDAPFTRVDLISCRNLLIYLEPIAQKRVMGLFHFGLRTGGILFLGPSETTADIGGEFETINPRWRLFRKRRDVRLPAELPLTTVSRSTRIPSTVAPSLPPRPPEPNMLAIFSGLLEALLPPSLLVNDRQELVHTFGDASRYLRWRSGKPSMNLLDLLPDDLKLAVSGALYRATREQRPISFSGIRIGAALSAETIQLSATPLPPAGGRGAYVLLSFTSAVESAAPVAAPSEVNLAEISQERVAMLEAELRDAREHLRVAIGDLEGSNAKWQAANEALLASNEELQSTNEELQSVNSELFTVNAEYQKKIAQLTELTHDMDNLLVSTDVHTMFLDARLRIRKFTPKMAEVFNLTSADTGRRIDRFMSNMACEGLTEKLASVLTHGRTYDEEVSNKAGDQFLMRILPYRGDTERSGVVMTLIDINEMKQAEARFRNAIEAAPSAMVMIDRDGAITLVNSETERTFGYQREELLGQPVELLIANRFCEEHALHRQRYFQHPRLRPMGLGLELWGKRKDASEFPIDVRLSPIETSRSISVLAAIVDITERKRLELSLRDQVKQRDRFLAVLSHELRNPMAAILNATTLLDRRIGEATSAQQPCDVIRRQASQMAAILDDLLDVSRVTQGKIHLRREVIDLTLVGKEAIEAVGPLLVAHRHDMDLEIADDPLWVDVDRSRVLQIIGNLLTNAIKYTPDGGRLALSLSREGRRAVIRVRDNGRGIPPQLLESIFDMFVQSEDTLDRSEGGMGLGLTLVRSLVSLHAGTIEVFSRGLHRGSEFVVRLPLTSKRPPRPSLGKASRVLSPLQIVLVEDSADARQMLEALLKLDGHTVHSAPDGLQGLELILQTRPDVALVDIGLPGMNGYELAREVRRKLGRDRMRLIALTGFGREEDHEAVLEAGFHEHLLKPVNMDELRATLAKDLVSAGDGE